eukprot:COSAG01_NODE_5170_length_4436_cov_159.454923_3_plen_50_part_00
MTRAVQLDGRQPACPWNLSVHETFARLGGIRVANAWDSAACNHKTRHFV